jgi:hypothetical protein
MKKAIIIFRFHKYPLVCLNRLELLRFYNPDTPVYGIYGGSDDELLEFERVLSDYLQEIYVIKNRTNEWKWKNFDLVLREWYNDSGKHIDFDMAYTNEWDLLIFGSLEKIYPGINSGDLGLSGIIPLSSIEKHWYWTTGNAGAEFVRLFEFVCKHYNYSSTPLASLCPGLCVPKSFLADYCKLYVPELCNDEIRLPLFAQILNYPVKDTGFFNGWVNEDERAYFNCDKRLIAYQTIDNELKSNGRKVFHPFREEFKELELCYIL